MYDTESACVLCGGRRDAVQSSGECFELQFYIWFIQKFDYYIIVSIKSFAQKDGSFQNVRGPFPLLLLHAGFFMLSSTVPRIRSICAIICDSLIHILSRHKHTIAANHTKCCHPTVSEGICPLMIAASECRA